MDRAPMIASIELRTRHKAVTRWQENNGFRRDIVLAFAENPATVGMTPEQIFHAANSLVDLCDSIELATEPKE